MKIPGNSNSSGFTLLELLLSTTIIAIIIVITYGAMRTGIRAWEKGEANVETRQRYRIILNMIKHQLSSICLSKIQYDTREPFYLKGSNGHIEFVSNRSMIPGTGEGLVYVKYNVEFTSDDPEESRLRIFEENFILMNQDSESIQQGEDQYVELLSGFDSITFQFLAEEKAKGTFEWVDSWGGKDTQKVFPRAVKIILAMEKESSPVTIIAAIHSEIEN